MAPKEVNAIAEPLAFDFAFNSGSVAAFTDDRPLNVKSSPPEIGGRSEQRIEPLRLTYITGIDDPKSVIRIEPLIGITIQIGNVNIQVP